MLEEGLRKLCPGSTVDLEPWLKFLFDRYLTIDTLKKLRDDPAGLSNELRLCMLTKLKDLLKSVLPQVLTQLSQPGLSPEDCWKRIVVALDRLSFLEILQLVLQADDPVRQLRDSISREEPEPEPEPDPL